MIGQTYDLALVKTLDPNTQMPIVPGGSITFLVEVINQGTLPAAGIEITDTLPASLTLNDAAWTASGSQAIHQYSGTILPGESDFVSLTATIDPSYMGGSLRNNAEISDDDSEVYGTTDVDSQPDGDPTNDAQGTDNQTDGDGTDDEDDADWADFVVEVYDLALTKVVNTVATNFPVYPGDSITYTLTVFNQGTLPASNIELTDYTPVGLTLNDPTWTLVNGNPTYQLAGPIVPGGQMEVDITFMINLNFTGTNFTNVAEISDDNSEYFGTADPDSDPDAINDDVLGEDNQLDGDGTDDSDDSDPADVMIGQIYDLSLDKAINEELTDFPVFPGDEVTYTITVTNEGTLPAADLEITDYTPDGLILNDADWTLVGTDAVMVIDGPILPGANTSVDITFIIDPEFTGYTFTNNAEITKDDADVYGTTDIDSAPGNGPNQEEDDDDDDVQVLNVDQIYDLALTKTLDESQLPVYPGDDVTFTFTIDNQGTLPAANIELTDYTPSGLTLNDADWTSVGNNAQTVFAGPIPA